MLAHPSIISSFSWFLNVNSHFPLLSLWLCFRDCSTFGGRWVSHPSNQGPGRTTLCRPPPSPTVPRRPISSYIVLCHPPPSSDVFRCFPPFSAVPCRPPPSPVVICSYLPSPGRSCLRSWGSSSLLMMAVLGIQGRGRTTSCRPVSSGGLGGPPTGPYGGPGRLRTLLHRMEEH